MWEAVPLYFAVFLFSIVIISHYHAFFKLRICYKNSQNAIGADDLARPSAYPQGASLTFAVSYAHELIEKGVLLCLTRF